MTAATEAPATLADVIPLADRRAARRLETAAARRVQAQVNNRHLRLVPKTPDRKTSTMNPEDQPASVQERVHDEVSRRMSEGNQIAWRAVALPIITALLLVVYYQSTTHAEGQGMEGYVFPAVIWLSGLLAAAMTLKVPMWIGGRFAAREVQAQQPDHKPGMGLRAMSVTPAFIGWSWTMVVATGNVLLGAALVVAMLPVLVFVTDTVLQVAFTAFHALPTQVAMEILDEDPNLFAEPDDDIDEAADAAVLEHEAEVEQEAKA